MPKRIGKSKENRQQARQQKEKSANPSNRVDELHLRIDRCKTIVEGLKGVGVWDLVIEDVAEEIFKLDSNWQYISDEKLWYEYKVTKLALSRIYKLVEQYEQEMEHYQKELNALLNTDKVISKDYDNETTTEAMGTSTETEA